MSRITRFVHLTLAAALLAAALPAVADQTPSQGPDRFGLLARVEALVAKVWAFPAFKPIGPDISIGGMAGKVEPHVEPVGAVGRIGVDGSPGGVPAPGEGGQSEAPGGNAGQGPG